jgi:hypothetical protein
MNSMAIFDVLVQNVQDFMGTSCAHTIKIFIPAEVGIESILAGCANTFISLTRAAATY